MANSSSAPLRKRFEVALARTVREILPISVEAESEGLVRDNLRELYQQAEGDDFDYHWSSDTQWGCEEGTHAIVRTTSVDGEADFTVTQNGVSPWAKPKTNLEEIIAAALTDPTVIKKLTNLSDSKFNARFIVQGGRVRVKIEDFEDLDE
jgi:hypothetical protein